MPGGGAAIATNRKDGVDECWTISSPRNGHPWGRRTNKALPSTHLRDARHDPALVPGALNDAVLHVLYGDGRVDEPGDAGARVDYLQKMQNRMAKEFNDKRDNIMRKQRELMSAKDGGTGAGFFARGEGMAVMKKLEGKDVDAEINQQMKQVSPDIGNFLGFVVKDEFMKAERDQAKKKLTDELSFLMA